MIGTQVPTFCRHSRLIQNCPICSREQQIEMRPVVIPGGQPARAAQTTRPEQGSSTARRREGGSRAAAGRLAHGLTVRRLSREAEDGFRSSLAPGLRSVADAEHLANELAFAATRLELLATRPPGAYAEVADSSLDLEERIWLAFEIAYLGPLDQQHPFEEIERVRRPWSSGEQPALEEVITGPRGAHDPARGTRTLDAYRAWAKRAGSQTAAFSGDTTWTAERRFARAFERLALPGFERAARFDLLVCLGRLGLFELEAGTLALGGADPVTLAAKRVLGIGDTMLLERRAAELARECGLPLEALDLGLFNWERGTRFGAGIDAATEPAAELLEGARGALGLNV
ncbi:MAG: alpha-glutamyl/putrescinyl thymine pyrophosphorylase clade 3 protein [Solirubrobacteraceae bacterium]